MTRRIVLVIYVVLVTLFIRGLLDVVITPDDIRQSITQSTCYEDEPCWDCHTMGNRICGPTHTEVQP